MNQSQQVISLKKTIPTYLFFMIFYETAFMVVCFLWTK